jgi:gliding motility-associated protein GldC
MAQSTITVNIEMDESRIPKSITWNASDATVKNEQKAKAMMLAFWDGAEKTALRIDLWTKDMMIDEMADFYYQTMMTMADSYGRATKQDEIVADMKKFAAEFFNKFRAQQLKDNKAS